MDNEDRQIGHILSRREVLRLVGVASVGVLVGCGAAETGTTTGTSVAIDAPTAVPTMAAIEAPATVATEAATSEAVSAEPTLNAEAQTAVAMEDDPTTVAPQQVEVATAEAANTELAAADGTTVPSCVVRPEVTEGPYYVDVDLVRADIREEQEGTPLTLTFNVS